MRDPQSVGLDFGACAVRPCEINSIIIRRDVAGYLNRELLDTEPRSLRSELFCVAR